MFLPAYILIHFFLDWILRRSTLYFSLYSYSLICTVFLKKKKNEIASFARRKNPAVYLKSEGTDI